MTYYYGVSHLFEGELVCRLLSSIVSRKLPHLHEDEITNTDDCCLFIDTGLWNTEKHFDGAGPVVLASRVDLAGDMGIPTVSAVPLAVKDGHIQRNGVGPTRASHHFSQTA